jgi:hypothetical protein
VAPPAGPIGSGRTKNGLLNHVHLKKTHVRNAVNDVPHTTSVRSASVSAQCIAPGHTRRHLNTSGLLCDKKQTKRLSLALFTRRTCSLRVRGRERIYRRGDFLCDRVTLSAAAADRVPTSTFTCPTVISELGGGRVKDGERLKTQLHASAPQVKIYGKIAARKTCRHAAR